MILITFLRESLLILQQRVMYRLEIRKLQSNFFWSKSLLTERYKAQKKNTLVSRNAGDEKNLHPGGHNFFLNQFN